MHGKVCNKHNTKICDNNNTKVRRGETEVPHFKSRVPHSTQYTQGGTLPGDCEILQTLNQVLKQQQLFNVMRGRFKREGTYVYLWLIHIEV